MREIFGLFFDETSGKLFTQEGDNFIFTGFTFVQVINLATKEKMNPLQFATRETADKLAARIPEFFPAEVEVVEAPQAISPVSAYSFPELLLSIKTPETISVHNAGLLASSIARIGWHTAMWQLKDEIKAKVNAEVKE